PGAPVFAVFPRACTNAPGTGKPSSDPGSATCTAAPKCAPWLRDRAPQSDPPCVQTAQRRPDLSTSSASNGSLPEKRPDASLTVCAVAPPRSVSTTSAVAVG